MTKSLLITRPNYDLPTTYLFFWSKLVIKCAYQKDFRVVDLPNGKSNKTDFSGRVIKTNPSFIFFNGHGNKSAITGHDGEVLVSDKKNLSLLKDRVIFSRSCSSAMKLGPKSISSGAKAFIGYKEPFIFILEPEKSSHPLSDKTATLFLEPSNQVAISLLKGHSSLEANKRGKNAFVKNIRKLLTSESKKEDSATLRYLFWDMKHQVCLGDAAVI